MENGKIRVHNRATLAMDVLSDTDRKRVLTAIELLRTCTASQWPPDGVKQLPTEEPIYVLRSIGGLRVFFRTTEDGAVEILDITRREMLERFVEQAAGPVASA